MSPPTSSRRAATSAVTARSEEFAPLLPGRSIPLAGGGAATLWTERLCLTTAKTELSYADGRPAVTRNAFGAGEAWYLSTGLAAQELREVFKRALNARDARIAAEGSVPVPAGAVRVVREEP